MATLAQLVILALMLAGQDQVQSASGEFPAGTRITFLSQDATPGQWDHSGCCGHALKPLVDLVAREYSDHYVKYDVGRLIRDDVAPYYIYNKRYCGPIERVLGANLFVMTQARLLNMAEPEERWRFDTEAKAYSSVSGRELVLFRAEDVTIEEVWKRVESQRAQMLRSLVHVAGADVGLSRRHFLRTIAPGPFAHEAMGDAHD